MTSYGYVFKTKPRSVGRGGTRKYERKTTLQSGENLMTEYRGFLLDVVLTSATVFTIAGLAALLMFLFLLMKDLLK
tara:strand:+ start:121 stop:348 length:228 start_codon:yes stop_codon:yes gene_type:complete